MELTLTTRTDPEREFFAVAVRSGRAISQIRVVLVKPIVYAYWM
jgi:hypothetical protein